VKAHKKIASLLISIILGKNIAGVDALRILNGPLKGGLLPRKPALDQPSMLFGRYEPAVISEILHLPETIKVSYDVGANVGYTTLALARRTEKRGEVFAFEPVASNVESIRQLMVLNHLEDRVRIVPLALGNTTGKQRLIISGSSSMHHLEATLDGQGAESCNAIVVQGSTIDSFVFEKKNPAPDLVKIDVEGAEALVVEGALRTLQTYSPAILMEIHGPVNARRVWDTLQDLNYHWLKLTKEGPSAVTARDTLLRYFTKDYWTHHFLLNRGLRTSGRN
jgi:FkbM family methyltransferase